VALVNANVDVRGHRARHVGDAIVNDPVEHEGGLCMRGGPARLEAAALIDGDVDEDRAGLSWS